MKAQKNVNTMKAMEKSPRMEYIREKHRMIYQQYLDLMKKENEENSLRARHIGKFYYAQQIADKMSPEMGPLTPHFILRIINNNLKTASK